MKGSIAEVFGKKLRLLPQHVPQEHLTSVTSIGDSAFSWCSSLKSVTIPNGVTSIGNYAFNGCSSLERINVDKENVNYSSIDGILYNKSQTEFIHIPKGIKGSITIPDTITSIGDYAFWDCSSLVSVTIGNGVTSIENSAFYNCSSLTRVTIGNGVTSIGEYAFSDCSSLESINVDKDNENYSSVDGIIV